MIIADFSMAGKIMDIDADSEFTNGIAERLRIGQSVLLLEDKFRACITYDPLDKQKWLVHILSKKNFRGKELWEFAYSTALWMVEERGMEYMLNIVDHDNKPLRVFVRYFGMPKAADMGDQALHITSAERIKNFASQKEV